MPGSEYVFGYASLVALEDAGAVAGRLRGYRRTWGAAMNNWEGGDAAKHWIDRETGERPHIRVAYLDLREQEGSAVNGVALPVDVDRLEEIDEREINYRRVDITADFEGPALGPLYTYLGLDAARERCRLGAIEDNVFVSRDYVAGVRCAFERLAPGALDEFDSTTDPCLFSERALRVVLPKLLSG